LKKVTFIEYCDQGAVVYLVVHREDQEVYAKCLAGRSKGLLTSFQIAKYEASTDNSSSDITASPRFDTFLHVE
jgi:hypothetical protein